MKIKLLSILTLGLLILPAKQQAQSYTFSQYNSAYSDLAGATVISSPGWDDFTIYDKTLPMPFKFYGVNQDSLYIMAGFVAFHENGAGNFDSDQIYVFDASLIERTIGGASTTSTLMSGTTPNRIYKVQTKNAGFADDASSGNDYANVQLWLYETSNIIEIHFGSSSVAAATYSPLLGPTVGIYKSTSQFLALSGPAANPSASSTMASLNVTGTPPSGLVYKFAPTTTGLNEQSKSSSGKLYPNPANGTVYFRSAAQLSNATIKVYNAIGQLVFEKNNITLSNGQTQKLDLGLTPGIYSLQVSNQNESFVPEKLIIE